MSRATALAVLALAASAPAHAQVAPADERRERPGAERDDELSWRHWLRRGRELGEEPSWTERASFTRLWRPRLRPPHMWAVDPSLRGWADGATRRPGMSTRGDGFVDHPWRYQEGTETLYLRVSDELRVGFRNVDEDALIDRWPGTIPEDVVGGEEGFSNLVRAEASGPILQDRALFHLELLDERTWDEVPLGAREAQRASYPRYTGTLTLRPDDSSEVYLGARYEALRIDDAGLSSWELPSAAQEVTDDATSVTVEGVRQIADRHQLRAGYDLVFARLDERPLNGITTPGHDNLDTYQVWGNHPWTERRRTWTQRADLRWSSFVDGLLLPDDGHTFTIGVQVEHVAHDVDATRNGGFTYRDAGACPDDSCQSTGDFLRIDPNDRSTWRLQSSDRGDELHASVGLTSLAAYVGDEITVGSRWLFTVGARVERFRGSFDRAEGVYEDVTVAPRASAVYHFTDDHLGAVFVQAGRHYRRFEPPMMLRAAEGAAYSPLEYWEWTGDPAAAPPGLGDPGWRRAEQFPADIGRVEEGLRHPYVDRLVLGLTWGLDEEGLRTYARYAYERHRDLLGIYDAAFSVYDAEENPGGTYARAPSDEAEFGPAPNDVSPYYDLREAGTQDYVLGNPPGAYRDVHRLDVGASMPVTDFLELAGRVVIADDRGNLDPYGGVSLDWRDPSGRLNADGPLRGFSPVEAELGAIIDLPGSVSIWLDYRFRRGAYYSRVRRVRPENNQRAFVYDLRGRGGYQYPDVHRLDARVQWRVDGLVPGTTRLWVGATNLLNAGTVTEVREVESSFESVRALQQPLVVRMGVSHDW